MSFIMMAVLTQTLHLYCIMLKRKKQSVRLGSLPNMTLSTDGNSWANILTAHPPTIWEFDVNRRHTMMILGPRQMQEAFLSDKGKHSCTHCTKQRLRIIQNVISLKKQKKNGHIVTPPASLSSLSSAPPIFHLTQPDVILYITISHPKCFFSSFTLFNMLVRAGVFFGLCFREL